jgi:hypothetical protein
MQFCCDRATKYCRRLNAYDDIILRVLTLTINGTNEMCNLLLKKKRNV